MDRYDIEKINSTPIVEVAERLGIGLKRKGVSYVGHCLWHEDSHPSMVVGGRYNACHCYACGAHKDVIGLVMESLHTDFKGACEWLNGSITTARTHGEGGYKHNGYEAIVMSKKPATYFPVDYVMTRVSMNSSFARCMTEVFGDDTAERVVEDYMLGAQQAMGRYPDVLFPSIDIDGRVRDIKVQAYECDERSEMFFHRLKSVCYWLGPKLDNDACYDRECLFGEHLLRQYPEKTVALVESPKNACVGAAQYPQYLWLATGNKGMLKREVLTVLHGRRVVVFPDNDAYDEWKKELGMMQDIALFLCMRTPGENIGKEDIADWIIREKAKERNNENLKINKL